MALWIILFYLFYRADPQVEFQFRILLRDKYICTIVSQKYQDLLQAYSHDRFSKILLTVCWGFFILQKQCDPNFLHDHFSKILRTFFVKKLIHYKTYAREDHVESIQGTRENMTKKRIQFEYLQAYSHD
jgi:hypothetical protein